jgi:hypothetical protein
MAGAFSFRKISARIPRIDGIGIHGTMRIKISGVAGISYFCCYTHNLQYKKLPTDGGDMVI